MFNDRLTRTSRHESEMWEILEENLKIARSSFEDADVEDKEDTIARESAKSGSLFEIAYRETRSEFHDRNHWLNMGRALLPTIESLLDRRELTPEFVQKWGTLMFCHGVITTYITDDVGGLAPLIASRKSAESRERSSHRRWFSILVLRQMDNREYRKDTEAIALVNRGRQRRFSGEKARAIVEEWIRTRLSERNFPQGIEESWLREFLNDDDALKSTYMEKRLTLKEMRKLAADSSITIPPTEFSLP